MKTKIRVMKKAGKPTIKFHEGGLHESTNTPAGEKIPESKIEAAESGAYGDKAKKQVQFMHNVLKK